MSKPRWRTHRTCPVCGNEFCLGEAAIIELKPGSNQSRGVGASSDALGDETSAGRGEPAIAYAGEGLKAGDMVTSSSDHEDRRVLAPAPSERSVGRRGSLPLPRDMARRYGNKRALARRGCPVCHHPLPEAIDDGDIPSVLLLGDQQSGKTALVAAIRAQSDGAYPDGRHRLSLTEESRDILDAIRYDDGDTLHKRYLKGKPLGRTQSGQRTPLTFVAKHRAGSSERSFVVLINDPAGEDIANPELRQEHVPALRWASVLVFMVPPRGEHGDTGQPLDRAGVVLNAIVTSFKDVRPELCPQLIVCASKADLEDGSNVLDRENLNKGPTEGSPYNESFVRGLVAERDEDIVVNAASWRGKPVLWRTVAAMPTRDEHRSKAVAEPTWGVVKLVDDIVSALG